MQWLSDARLDRSRFNIWLPFAILLLSAAWLLPNHYLPWTAFHSEALAVLWLLPLWAWVVLRCPSPHTVSPMSLVFLLLAALVGLQAATGMLHMSGHVVLGMGYLLCAAAAVHIGLQMQQHRPGLLLSILLGAFVLSSLASVYIQLRQWLALFPDNQFSIAGILMMRNNDSRAYANLAQPNQLATLLSWGLIAGYWLHRQYKGSMGLLVFYVLLLGFGMALTQSRTGLLQFALISLLFWLLRERFQTKAYAALTLLCVAWVLVLSAILPQASEWLMLDYEARPVHAILKDVPRLRIYEMYVQALALQPLIGFGFGRHIAASYAAADHGFGLGMTSFYSHNIVLDVVLWFGLPVGLLVTGFALWRGWRLWRGMREFGHVAAALVILVFLIHANLELPHAYTYYLIPVCMLWGLLEQSQPRMALPRAYASARLLLVGCWLAVAGVTAAVIYDYFRYEETFWQLRLASQRVGKTKMPDVPTPMVLNQVAGMLEANKAYIKAGLSDAELAELVRINSTEPTPHSLFVLAANFAIRGRYEEAQTWVNRINGTLPKPTCDTLAQVWRNETKTYPAMLRVTWP